MLGANLSWGVAVVGTGHGNHRACDVPAPEVVESDQGQILNQTKVCSQVGFQLSVRPVCICQGTTGFS